MDADRDLARLLVVRRDDDVREHLPHARSSPRRPGDDDALLGAVRGIVAPSRPVPSAKRAGEARRRADVFVVAADGHARDDERLGAFVHDPELAGVRPVSRDKDDRAAAAVVGGERDDGAVRRRGAAEGSAARRRGRGAAGRTARARAGERARGAERERARRSRASATRRARASARARREERVEVHRLPEPVLEERERDHAEDDREHVRLNAPRLHARSRSPARSVPSDRARTAPSTSASSACARRPTPRRA